MNHNPIDIFTQRKKRRHWPIVLFLFMLVGGISFFGYYKLIHLKLADVFETDFVQDQLQSHVPQKYKGTLDILPTLLGFESPQTYLVLFQNDTEMRPGGGFIGSYATLRVSEGNISVLALEGTETLDARTPASWNPVPPAIMKKELGVDRWYFRDSNWDPFFIPNAKRALEFYIKEGGVAGNDIHGVIMIDTTLLEEMLAITGPITVQGIEFTKENLIETLEYEVEYGYEQRGISFQNRKQIMKPLFDAILKKVAFRIIAEPEQFIAIGEELAREKHIAIYMTDAMLQKEIESIGFAGAAPIGTGDYLLWVDANLAALKTDHAIDRSLSYTMKTEGDKRIHIATMSYLHTGIFDWRTSRYRTYARVFVPHGSELVEIRIVNEQGVESTLPPGSAIQEQYSEILDAFAYFFVVEPGDTKSLSFVYRLPESLQRIEPYTLVIPKQLGTDTHGLTLDLDFGKNITAATPPEVQTEWGDGVYRVESNLQEDREFLVNF